MKKHYWFADEPKEVVNALLERHGKISLWSGNPIMAAWARNVYAYHSTVLDVTSWETSLQFAGEQGELIRMSVPQARSLIRQLITLITKKRLSFDCIAETKGMDVMSDVRLGSAVINQIIEQERIDQKADILAEKALVYGHAFLKTTWNPSKGKPYVPADDGSILYDGAIDMQVYGPDNVFYQHNIPSWDEQQWAEVRVIKNRWDLIAQHPELEQEILALPNIHRWKAMSGYEASATTDDDGVYCYEVFHKPTPALPKGRMLMYADEKTIFYDGDNQYDGIPIEPMCPEQIDGMFMGYPFFSNLLPCQEMLDHSFSAWATVQSAHAVTNVTVARGSGISAQEINGMNFLSYTPQNVPGGGKPEVLNLSQMGADTFKGIDMIYNHMQQLSNISGALRGNLPSGVTSGTAIATLTTNSLEFINNMQKSFDLCMEKSMWHAINATKKFSKIPKNVNVQGKNNQSSSKQYVGSDLHALSGVKIIQVSPVMQTMAGRLDIAEKLIQAGLIKSPNEYVALMEGAPLRQVYETELSESDLIQSENESMMDGTQIMALSTDDHACHIRKHKTLLNDPMVRMQNDKIGAILNHIQQHIQLAQTTDPMLLAMALTGQMPQGGPPPMGPPPGSGGPPPSHGGPPGGAEADQAPPKGAKPTPDPLGRA